MPYLEEKGDEDATTIKKRTTKKVQLLPKLEMVLLSIWVIAYLFYLEFHNVLSSRSGERNGVKNGKSSKSFYELCCLRMYHDWAFLYKYDTTGKTALLFHNALPPDRHFHPPPSLPDLKKHEWRAPISWNNLSQVKLDKMDGNLNPNRNHIDDRHNFHSISDIQANNLS